MSRAISDKCRVLFLCLAGVALGLTAVAPAQGQAPDERVKRVLDAWQKRQQAFRSIRYTISGVGVRPKGFLSTDTGGQPLLNPEPAEDASMPQEYRILLDFIA